MSECIICYKIINTTRNTTTNTSTNKIFKTTCNHIYHNNCIEEWLKKNNTCPICRTIISNPPKQKLYYNSYYSRNRYFNDDHKLSYI
jgi:SUMO ligase MMS21 Smc5/6 complex component